jgi:hypothetical protein
MKRWERLVAKLVIADGQAISVLHLQPGKIKLDACQRERVIGRISRSKHLKADGWYLRQDIMALLRPNFSSRRSPNADALAFKRSGDPIIGSVAPFRKLAFAAPEVTPFFLARPLTSGALTATTF